MYVGKDGLLYRTREEALDSFRNWVHIILIWKEVITYVCWKRWIIVPYSWRGSWQLQKIILHTSHYSPCVLMTHGENLTTLKFLFFF